MVGVLTGCDRGDTAITPDRSNADTAGTNADPASNQETTHTDHADRATDTARITDTTLTLRNQRGLTIRGKTIRADPAIALHGCVDITLIDCDLTRVVAENCRNLRIVNSTIHDSADEGVFLDGCADVLVQHNRFQRVKTGVLAHQSTGVRIIENHCTDVLGPLPGGQLVQFDQVTGSNNVIRGNIAINHRVVSNPEDVINLHRSHGTRDSPILVEKNYLVGDPEHGSAGKSDSGSGIMLGDGGGRWQLCRNNTLISPGQVGIGVAGGADIVVEGNLVLGRQSDVSNVGLYVWNQYKDEPAGRVMLKNNTVAWVNAKGQDNPYWQGGGFEQVVKDNNTFGGRTLLESTTPPQPPQPPQVPVVPDSADASAQ